MGERNAARVRIAPSPTGYFHVGTGRTALFNWLFARHEGGTFILRIEDTDTARNVAEHAEGIQRALIWLGLDWDEGPYFQSQRAALYDAAVGRLLGSGAAYACDCTREQIAGRADARGGPPGYDGHCRERGLEAAPSRMVRFRTPDAGYMAFDDIVRDNKPVENSKIEDFGLRKSTGEPLFILANAVDDAEMAVTHVIRGEDHVSNTYKYLLLWEALGYGDPPAFAHLPLLLNSARKKLSKRRDKVAVEDYRDEGYLPEAMRNYLGLLGWSPSGGREIVTVEEMIGEFRLEDVKKAPAIFDEVKLQAVNADYLRSLPPEDFVDRAQSWIRAAWEPLAPLVQERSRTLRDAYTLSDFLYRAEPVIDPEAWDKEVGKNPSFGAILTAAAERYGSVDWNASSIQGATVAAGEACGLTQLSKVQAPIRLAVMGRPVGAPLWQSLELLGRDRTLSRMQAALRRLQTDSAGGDSG